MHKWTDGARRNNHDLVTVQHSPIRGLRVSAIKGIAIFPVRRGLPGMVVRLPGLTESRSLTNVRDHERAKHSAGSELQPDGGRSDRRNR